MIDCIQEHKYPFSSWLMSKYESDGQCGVSLPPRRSSPKIHKLLVYYYTTNKLVLIIILYLHCALALVYFQAVMLGVLQLLLT